MPPAFRILVADAIHEQWRSLLASHRGLEIDAATGLNEAALCERIADYDALIVRSKTRVPAAVTSGGRRIKVIGRAGIGVDYRHGSDQPPPNGPVSRVRTSSFEVD